MSWNSIIEDHYMEMLSNIRETAIATTDQCNIKCEHCLMMSGPSRKEKLSYLSMKRFIDSLRAKSKLNTVVFTGGESTLLGEDLFSIISYSSSIGLGTRLVTNGSWAINNCATEDMILYLLESGLNELNISTDDFHAKEVSLDCVRRIWKCAKGRGFSAVILGVCSGPESRVTPQFLETFLGEKIPYIYDAMGNKQIPEPNQDGTVYAISNTGIAPLGRGRHLKDGWFRKTRKVEHPFIGRCPNIYKPLTLMADGTIGACCGINCERTSILSIKNIYNDESYFFGEKPSYEQQIIICALDVLGPAYLYTIATGDVCEHIRGRNISACQICEFLFRDNSLTNKLFRSIDQIEFDVISQLVSIDISTPILN